MLATHFPKLSRSQVRTLALWSFAATITQHIASTTCACFLARLFEQPQANFRQRLREFYWEAEQKTGTRRQALAIEGCFAPLMRWILSLYRGADLVLALDVTLLRDRLAVLSLSVVFRGSALPVAWKMLVANEKGAWITPCITLLDYLGQGQLFKTNPLSCTLVAIWEAGYDEPWLLMTDLAPVRCQGSFYGLRSWIEQGFRSMKSGAYRCERLRVVDPERAERIWLVLAVSMLWTHAVGSQVQRAQEPCGLSAVLAGGIRRVLGVHREGWIALLVSALRGDRLPLPALLVVDPRPAAAPGMEVILKEPP